MARHIRRGPKETKLSPKYKGNYGKHVQRNIAVFQGSAISATMFIIYMGDVMGNFEAPSKSPILQSRITQDIPRRHAGELRQEMKEMGEQGG